ncbi:hypothetical protein DFA_10155 [Cavenderia fasciculata]|uniref:Uncharacterized protein n=1 Tax=Cavenderia fasciculata TaxID=261658 RepID=F4Q9F2_CACFS|nr:uncharacterized protein DFA_10155 [Cavenderia fasciculata]EGG15321.1 hypothetical protein DFA_10155 [Cavenderia fasciculata]|eukprot:XP_004352041.1 hypothetical protein DFA_10155 [Cavenderia fasciculata]
MNLFKYKTTFNLIFNNSQFVSSTLIINNLSTASTTTSLIRTFKTNSFYSTLPSHQSTNFVNIPIPSSTDTTTTTCTSNMVKKASTSATILSNVSTSTKKQAKLNTTKKTKKIVVVESIESESESSPSESDYDSDNSDITSSSDDNNVKVKKNSKPSTTSKSTTTTTTNFGYTIKSKDPLTIIFDTTKDLNDWYKTNHKTMTEVYMGFYYKATGLDCVSYMEAIDESLCFGWIDGVRKKGTTEYYLQRFTPRRTDGRSNWSAVNIAKVQKLQAEGRMKPAGLAAFDKRENRTLEDAISAENPEFDDECMALLKAHKKALTFFNEQSATYQKYTKRWVMSAKREETRHDRMQQLVESNIQDNVDIVCLLFTCKQLYHNNSIRRSIKFKGIDVIDNKEEPAEISKQFIATISRFNLNSFKDILDNSISYQHVVLHDLYYKRYPKWIQDHLYSGNIVDKSNITTAIVLHDSKTIESLYDIPSIETLYITYNESNAMNLAISRLPNLQRLEVSAWRLDLDKHESLKSLVIDVQYDEGNVGYGYPLLSYYINEFVSLTELTFKMFIDIDYIELDLLPISLTSLTLRLREIPPRDSFSPLVSLVYLAIDMNSCEIQGDGEDEILDLDGLPNLKTFKLKECGESPPPEYLCTEISVPPSIKILTLLSDYIRIAPQSTMPLLETLNVSQSLLINDKISLSQSPSIKKLVIDHCNQPMPDNIVIPPTVKRLRIIKETKDDILGQVKLPSSLLHLTVKGGCYEAVQQLPESLVKLQQTESTSPVPTLPQHLKKLTLYINDELDDNNNNNNNINNNINYPPHLETLNLLKQGDYTIDVPPTIKNLSIVLRHQQHKLLKMNDKLENPIYSISSRIDKSITTQQSKQQQWLPTNTTHLTCYLKDHLQKPLTFRLDEIINHTNVRYLTLIVTIDDDEVNFDDEVNLQFSIHRLDSDNNNVLVLERQSLTGGIITQRKNNKQKQYDPIYLYFDGNSPFEFHWSFNDKMN